MALILYPLTNYDAFVSVADCKSILTANIIGSQREAFDALIDADIEIYIRQSTILIKGKITLPTTLEDDLQTATAYLVNYSIGKDMTNEDGKGLVKRKEIVDIVETEYFAPRQEQNEFPDIVTSLLTKYDGVSDGSFVFERA